MRGVAERSLAVVGDAANGALTLDSAIGDWFSHPVAGPLLQDVLLAGMTEEQRRRAEAGSDLTDVVASIPAGQYPHFPGVPVSADDLNRILEAMR
ncbi:hypothetical protein C5F59_006940 [Streptomyces sp. QL37]|uniref:hypothetical protein n=1 Tax=Streptomyces sp. QL37 TaxID=2093747 RepID=UPI000CF28F74|nr:hypothetical protein [Streptomyces sp. QL37]PPQ56439.1 hypothetical protein C5F59_07015 [Streptomyces sp. QL37]